MEVGQQQQSGIVEIVDVDIGGSTAGTQQQVQQQQPIIIDETNAYHAAASTAVVVSDSDESRQQQTFVASMPNDVDPYQQQQQQEQEAHTEPASIEVKTEEQLPPQHIVEESLQKATPAVVSLPPEEVTRLKAEAANIEVTLAYLQISITDCEQQLKKAPPVLKVGGGEFDIFF